MCVFLQEEKNNLKPKWTPYSEVLLFFFSLKTNQKHLFYD